MLNISKLKLNNINKNILVNKGQLTSEIKHHPSSTKEWLNSIFNYYKNNEKNMFNLDNIVYKIIKNYFNMYSSRLEKSIFLRKKTLRKRRYRLNSILISKPEFKHTNDKVKIILYVYNTELSFLNLKVSNLKKKIFAQYFYKIFTTKYITFSKLSALKSLLKRINTLKLYIDDLNQVRNLRIKKLKSKVYKNHFIASNTIKDCYKEWFYLKSLYFLMRNKGMLRVGNTLKYFEKKGNNIRNSIKEIILNRSKDKLEAKNLLQKYGKVKLLNKSIKIVKFLSVLLNKFNRKFFITSMNFYNNNIKSMPTFYVSRRNYMSSLKKMIFRLRLLLRYNRIITFNKLKFNVFLSPLKLYLEKIYKKEIEFDIITVKNYRLNSSLLTQVIAIKLRNRKNRLNRLFSKVVNTLKLPVSKRHEYLKQVSKNRLLQNIILKQNINKTFILRKPLVELKHVEKQLKDKKLEIEFNKLFYISNKGDKLDLLLKSIYTNENIISHSNIILSINKDNVKQLSNKLLIERNLENVVLDSIKNKSISGIKIEASGRLTKRAVAARSSSSIIQRGTIKDINSSYKKLPGLLLKGNLKPNTQFTKISDNTRIGSFGLKGWITSV